MLDKNGKEMTADKLNDDGVVLIICTIFGLYDDTIYRNERHDSDSEFYDPMARLFGGVCAVGNSHNDAYQLGLNMTRLALRKYTGNLTR